MTSHNQTETLRTQPLVTTEPELTPERVRRSIARTAFVPPKVGPLNRGRGSPGIGRYGIRLVRRR